MSDQPLAGAMAQQEIALARAIAAAATWTAANPEAIGMLRVMCGAGIIAIWMARGQPVYSVMNGWN